MNKTRNCFVILGMLASLTPGATTQAGLVLLSTSGSVSVPGISAADEDVLRFAPTSLGPQTAGAFAMFFDASAHGVAGYANLSAVEVVEVLEADATAAADFDQPFVVGSPGGGTVPAGVADLNADGVVDGLDLGILLSNWSF